MEINLLHGKEKRPTSMSKRLSTQFRFSGISRGSPEGVSFVNFIPEQFSYLNITRIDSDLVQDGSECGFACLEITSCFSYNLAAFPDINGKLLCELLPSDKYNNSDKFIASPIYNHFSIAVSTNKTDIKFYSNFCI